MGASLLDLYGPSGKPLALDFSKLRGKSGMDVPYSNAEKALAAIKVKSWQDAAPLGSGAQTLGLPGGWKDFMDFHNQQAAMAQGRGNNYGVNMGSISGGGDLNEKTNDSVTPTRQVGGGMASGQALRALKASAGVGGGDDLESQNLLKDAAGLDLVNAQDDRQFGLLDRLRKLTASREAMNYAPGTPGFTDRTNATAAMDRRNDQLDSEAASDATTKNYWRNGQPIETYKNDVTQQNLDAANTRQLNIENTKLQGQVAKAVAALQGARSRDEMNLAIAQLKTLASRAGNMAQYGQDTDALDAELATRLGMGGGGGGSAQAPGAPPTAPQPPSPGGGAPNLPPGQFPGQKATNRRTGQTLTWDGSEWK